MLEIVNTYLHGFVAAPMLSVCREVGIFAAMKKTPVSVQQITDSLSVNPGYCRLVLRGLCALDCVETKDGQIYAATERLSQVTSRLPEKIEEIYQLDFSAFLFEGKNVAHLERWMGASARGWDGAQEWLVQLLDGAIIVPVFLELEKKGLAMEPGELAAHLHPEIRTLMHTWLLAKELIKQGKSFVLNSRGRYLSERALTMAVTASYKPMLLGLKELLCGDPKRVLSRDIDGHETYVDRTLNVIGSGFQHGKYFKDLAELVTKIFDTDPVAEQPRYIVDMGCGDGALLKTLYNAVALHSKRGRQLEEYPLLVVGADFNRQSLEAAKQTLVGLPHLLLHGDIAQPQALLNDLAAHGISDADSMLHVRSFLDHDRPFGLQSCNPNAPSDDDHIYVDAAGNWLHSSQIVNDLRAHLERWSDILGRHGLILLEVFALPVQLTRDFYSQTESFSFDFYHALSGQMLVDAGTFHQALASAGLYPERESLIRYPRTTTFSRIVLQHVRPKPFAIRLLRLDDMPDLLAMDSLCWPKNLRLCYDDILLRHRTFANGQFVIEHEQRVVGVVYTQRIEDVDQVLALRHADYSDAHVNTGRYWQLLGISVHPDYQSLALGDQLLLHVLDLAALTAGVVAVYGITRCLAFRDQRGPMDDYIRRKDEDGLPIDSLLRFHCTHGATIEKIVPGAWPEDVDNGGTGVLIRYDLADRLQGSPAGTNKPRDEATPGFDEASDTSALKKVSEAIRRIMKTPDAFVADRPLKELGLDSMGLMELRLLLNRAFPLELDPAFFFNYPTAMAIAGFIDERSAPKALARPEQTPALSRRPASRGGADIAIVGMALRFPGGISTPEAFWQLLVDEGCVIGQRPEERWREYHDELDKLGTQFQHIHQGGFLKDIEQFDAAFFHITPVEAEAMDPQQRLLHELVWEALEHAGIDPNGLAGREVGTFLGAYTHDYEALTLHGRMVGDLDAYFGVGNALSAAAGRLAYFFDFRGPTMTVDTACSSSSCAIFSAVQSLVNGDTELAVAGSVNMMIGPTLSVTFAKAGMLSPDGLCKTFDSTANGYVRSEGGTVLLLKRLDDALRDGDQIHALIKSAALLQDGRTNGLTAPNGKAQVDVIRRALDQAGCTAADISYVEAHGTGTYLGDPVEMQALRSAYCDGVTRSSALCVGSVKTNLGHTEAVSGMAGLIKVVLAMQHKRIPAHLHVKQVSELLNLKDGQIEIPLQTRDWDLPQGGSQKRPRLAGVSSFGFSGSNTHIIVEEFIAQPVLPSANPLDFTSKLPVVVSAKSKQSLRNNIDALARYVDQQGDRIDLKALSVTLTQGRAHHTHRIAFAFGTLNELRQQLNDAILPSAGKSPRIAFMFTGQGAQYHGMAQSLAQASPSYQAHLNQCAALVHRYGGFDLFEVLKGENRALIDQTRYTQVVLFCIEYGLAELLREAGINASVVLGHSVGEYAAACYAGVMSLESTIRLLCYRGELMQEQTRQGVMAALLAPLPVVEKLLLGFDQVSIAAMNGPKNQVLAGDPVQMGEILHRAEQAGIPVFALPVERAFHSPLMEPILPLFRQRAEELDYDVARLTLISNVSGTAWTSPFSAQYWTDHIRLPVRFDQSVRSLVAHGVDLVIEIGPKPILTRMAAAVSDSSVCWLPSLIDAKSHGLAAIYTMASQAGLDINWHRYPHESTLRLTNLPRYQFERAPYWLKELQELKHATNTLANVALKLQEMPTSNADDNLFGELVCFRRHVNRNSMGDGALWAHVIGSESVFPASGHVVLLLEASLRLLKRPVGVALRNLRVAQMLTLDQGGDYVLELTAQPSSSPLTLALEVHARKKSGEQWLLCAQTTAEPAEERTGPAADNALAVNPDMPSIDGMTVLQGVNFYERLAALGYAYQPPFQGARILHYADETCVAELSFADNIPAVGYAAHPWSVDCCFQTVLAVMLDVLEADSKRLLLPDTIGCLAWYASLPAELRVVCRCHISETGVNANLQIFDLHGVLCCSVQDLGFVWVQRRSLGILGLSGSNIVTDDVVLAKVPNALQQKLAQLSKHASLEEYLHCTRQFVVEQIVRITDMLPESINLAAPLFALGMDSLMSADLVDTLSESLGKKLPATLLFDHPTLDALVAYLLEESGLDRSANGQHKAREEAVGVLSNAVNIVDMELAEIEALLDDDLEALIGKEFIRE